MRHSQDRSVPIDVPIAHELLGEYLRERDVPPDHPHARDLQLACGCALGVDAALRLFEREIVSRLPGMLARLRPSPELVDETAQALREKLFVGAAPRIREYAGRGPLVAWVRIVAIRLAVDLMRTRKEPLAERLDERCSLLESATSPELAAARNRYRPLFKQALDEAMASLSTEQRALLRLHYADGLTMDDLARLFAISRSTANRRLLATKQAVIDGIRARLRTHLGVSSQELDSLTGLVRSDLELSLSGWSATGG